LADESRAPEATKGDVAHAVTKGAISTVPVLGGLAAEIFGEIVRPPLQKRTVHWLNGLAGRIKKLEEGGNFRIESLADNELFVSVVAQAVAIAGRNHQLEKLDALQNAVVNTASGISIDENQQLLFLSLVDYLTALHLKILVYFNDPPAWFRAQGRPVPSFFGAPPGSGLEEAVPELRDRRDLYDSLVEELYSRGLLNTDRNGMHTIMSTCFDSRTTALGKEFIRYISSA
jgi:hypothetical protein